MTESQKRYREYLNSNHWKELKSKKEMRTQKRCAICGSTENVQCHHMNYKDWYSVQTSDLRWMCGRCHKLAHELMDAGKMRFTSESQHHRFAVMKAAMKRHWGLHAMAPVFNCVPSEA